MLATEPHNLIDLKELTSYQYYSDFHLLLYSRTTANIPLFFLHKSPESASFFTHFSGNYTKHDPNIFFAVAREFVNHTGGLLHTENLKYMLAENANPYQLE